MILNIGGYRFVVLDDLVNLKQRLLTICQTLDLKGTVLLSPEGINISLAGSQEAITSFKEHLTNDVRLQNMRFHESLSPKSPFKRLKIKIKKEIITLRQEQSDPLTYTERAPHISPTTLKAWLDEKRHFVLLDTRNEYEINYGSFETATNPHIHHFTELPNALSALATDQPIVMFCTGGIRCEKAAHYMRAHGFNNVYQLDGGILGYFKEIGQAHWQGNCFVFDERIALNANLSPTT
jgi:UPF0176 protein